MPERHAFQSQTDKNAHSQESRPACPETSLSLLSKEVTGQPLRSCTASSGSSQEHAGEVGKATTTGIVDGASSLAAGIVAGGATLVAARFGCGRLAMLATGAITGSVTKYKSKEAIESRFVKPQDRTLSNLDILLGGIDGASGFLGAQVEKAVGVGCAEVIARYKLGDMLYKQTLIAQGEKYLEEQVLARIVTTAFKTGAGGGVGTATSSLAHHTADAVEKRDGSQILPGVMHDTAYGVVFGSTVGATCSLLANRHEFIGKMLSYLPGQSSQKLTILHFNDLHSSLLGEHGFSRLANPLRQIKSAIERKGTTAFTLNLGDEYSGNFISNFTRGGQLENEAIAGLLPTASVPGNHCVDGYGIGRYLQITRDNKLPGGYRTLCANLDVTDPQLARLADRVVRPYLIEHIPPTNGSGNPVKVGIIGLTTKELETRDVNVKDPIETARLCVQELQAQGVDKIIVASHLGTQLDMELASQVKGLSAIIGGHSHDAMATPVWVKNGEHDVPIFQVGSQGKYLGELNLVWDQAGKVDRFRTSGNPHPIDSTIPEVQDIKAIIDRPFITYKDLCAVLLEDEARTLPKAKDPSGLYRLSEVLQIADQEPGFARGLSAGKDLFPLPAGTYYIDGMREKETALGSLIADGLLAGMNNHRLQAQLPPLDGFLLHSGGIRNGLPSGQEIRLSRLADLFCTGQCFNELTTATTTGATLKRILEFGVADMTGDNGLVSKSTVADAARQGQALDVFAQPDGSTYLHIPRLPTVKGIVQMVGKQEATEAADHSGNFLQVSGIKYDIDLTAQPGSRVSNIRIYDHDTSTYNPVDSTASYTFGTRLHPIDKWAANGLFLNDAGYNKTLSAVQAAGNMDTKEALKAAARIHLQAPDDLHLSQPQLTADYLNGKTQLPDSMFSQPPRRDLLGRPRLSGSAADSSCDRIRFQAGPRLNWSVNATVNSAAANLYRVPEAKSESQGEDCCQTEPEAAN